MIQNQFAGRFGTLSHSSVTGARGYVVVDDGPDFEQFVIISPIIRKKSPNGSKVGAVLTDFPSRPANRSFLASHAVVYDDGNAGFHLALARPSYPPRIGPSQMHIDPTMAVGWGSPSLEI